MTPETLQQANMFTGEWETRHGRPPPQMPMFSVHETFDFGARVRPYLWEAAKPQFEFIREDAPSDVTISEETLQALMREAAALTSQMFAAMPEGYGQDEPACLSAQVDAGRPVREDPDDEDGSEPPAPLALSVEVPKLCSYRALVTLVREQAETLWVDGAYRQRYYNQLPLTIQDAQGAGLTATEISAAMQIGEFLGNRERQSASSTSHVIFDASSANPSSSGEAANSEPAPPTSSLSPQPATRGVEPREGLRARLRREHIPVRTRQPKVKAPEIAPVEWMERAYIQKRLPYLAEGIARLDEDELASLAESISAVLHETYWTILGITLSHYLDYEQGERRERTV
jgi:hypothetical protein